MRSTPLTLVAAAITAGVAYASQSYNPPPPPKLPLTLSEKLVATGKELFERNTLVVDRLEIHNFLGNQPCSACHDQKTPLKPSSLAANFKNLKAKINDEITQRMGGTPLPLEDPAMEGLVQYMIYKYKLSEYKLLK
ncbi:MAG: hypothetical protein V1495_03735 [Pseudomonadota bacterium]